MAYETVTLAAIDKFIASRRKGLAFPPWLEEFYETDTRRRRALRLRSAIPMTVVIYNFFLLLDWLIIPDRIVMSVVLHFAFVTPWIIVTGLLTTQTSSKVVREALAGSIPVVIVIQILCLYAFTSSENAPHYQYFVLLTVLFTNTVQRLPFPYSAVVSGIILASHTLAIWLCGQMSGPAALVAEITLVVATYLTLLSNYFVERDGRRVFLHALRDKLQHAETELAAKYDALTGLANRHYLAKRLRWLWQQTDDAVSPVAIIMIDIDHFKHYNDRYRHGAGDDCLKRVAGCVIATMRSDRDLAVRYGGEELLVLLPSTDAYEASQIAETIRQAIEQLQIPNEDAGHVISVSCGVAAAPASTVPAAELIAAADAALYAAKRGGRNRVWPPHSQANVSLLQSRAS